MEAIQSFQESVINMLMKHCASDVFPPLLRIWLLFLILHRFHNGLETIHARQQTEIKSSKDTDDVPK